MKSIKSNASALMQSSGWNNLFESNELQAELWNFCLNKRTDTVWSVRTLREMLEENNLELDGTKQMLIDRLKDNNVI